MHVCQCPSATALWQGDLAPILLPTKPRTLAHSTQSVTTACALITASCVVIIGSVMDFGLAA